MAANSVAAERTVAVQAINDFSKKVGASAYQTERGTLRLVGMTFDGPAPQGWKSIGGTSRRGGKQSFAPRKGSVERMAMRALPIISNNPGKIAEALGIPTMIDYVDAKGAYAGGVVLALPGDECGFAYPATSGPFLLWIPDVEKAVESCEKTLPNIAPHLSVSPDIKSYRPEFEGCRKILREEWGVIVAQHALQSAQAKEADHAES